MPRPYSNDLRMRAVEKVQAGESRRGVAKELRVAPSSVIKWARRYSDTGSAGPSRMGTRRAPKLAGCRAWILERINACPAITSAGLQDWLGGRGVAGESRLDLALSESLPHHPQAAGARRGRARPARRAAPPRAAEALSGPGEPAQAGLHRRDLHEDRHVAQARPGPQGTKGSRPGPLRPLGNLHIHGRSAAGPDRRSLGSGRPGRRRRLPGPMSKRSWFRRPIAATSSSWTLRAAA